MSLHRNESSTEKTMNKTKEETFVKENYALSVILYVILVFTQSYQNTKT